MAATHKFIATNAILAALQHARAEIVFGEKLRVSLCGVAVVAESFKLVQAPPVVRDEFGALHVCPHRRQLWSAMAIDKRMAAPIAAANPPAGLVEAVEE